MEPGHLRSRESEHPLGPGPSPRSHGSDGFDAEDLAGYLDDCRQRVLEEIREIVPAATAHGSLLYELMLDYPLRPAKALRPALAIATCRALGGHLEAVLRSAAVLELYHNAFLIHDDVEDGSEKRRREETLHRLHGVPIAVNVGDGMLALALQPLLDNVALLGLGRALRILQVVARMARESAEGQMMELAWVRNAHFLPRERDYVRMVYKKTTWYTFLAPVLVGAIAAGAPPSRLRALAAFATPLGVAFQIQDDLLNLVGEEAQVGKERDGDLWEGKHTWILIHALREASADERAGALAILGRRRFERSAADVHLLRDLITRHGGITAARAAAQRRARRAEECLQSLARDLAPSVHLAFLRGLVDFVGSRER